MPIRVETKGNPYCVRDEWYFTDERGKQHGPYLSLGRATIAMGKHIRDKIESPASASPILFAVACALIFIVAGWVMVHG